MKRKKIAIVGSGFTGQGTALFAAARDLGDIVLVDLPARENYAKGVALDMMEAMPVYGSDTRLVGTSDYAEIAGADVVVITAGVPRKPGMSREDLVNTNAGIVKDVAEKVARYAPDSVIIVLTNPVDSMTYVALKASGFPKNRVIGQSGVLDTARFRTFLANAIGCSFQDVVGCVLGGHGDDMVPLVRYTSAGGIPVEKLLPKETIDAIVERTRKGGGEIVNLMGTSAGYAPGMALVEMIDAILNDRKRILPSIAYLEGEYGYTDMCLGVMTVLGGGGLEKVIELDLTDEEKVALDKGAQGVRNLIEMLKAGILAQ
ncbi:malate dehydrogenase [Symbiobacterium thermophilum]|uniref:Malate dehydrogenase n=1 Tax=Symbiobacterium thermophilum (strain DSM 24528 / JCM 14929 / IAM 14863 / T) TaxID=292459 RepID=MDH_SYMTH|nr:malate dehydrogenase [Symbiobacterium thermophilum]Q67LB8.1 RecName: Full=Malate dehydrogenase [Symbiobacterium thermophilum IAM 14863]BAD41528.1 malate dehydrogenase [Symbiobacterium thermophilum IAM 14863]